MAAQVNVVDFSPAGIMDMVDAVNAAGLQTVLILGATPNEGDTFDVNLLMRQICYRTCSLHFETQPEYFFMDNLSQKTPAARSSAMRNMDWQGRYIMGDIAMFENPSFASPYLQGKFDLIVMDKGVIFNVFQSPSEIPFSFLVGLAELLKPEGMFMIPILNQGLSHLVYRLNNGELWDRLMDRKYQRETENTNSKLVEDYHPERPDNQLLKNLTMGNQRTYRELVGRDVVGSTNYTVESDYDHYVMQWLDVHKTYMMNDKNFLSEFPVGREAFFDLIPETLVHIGPNKTLYKLIIGTRSNANLIEFGRFHGSMQSTANDRYVPLSAAKARDLMQLGYVPSTQRGGRAPTRRHRRKTRSMLSRKARSTG